MAEKTISMLNESLDAFTNGNVNLAQDVCFIDNEVDKLSDQVR
jgi:phosphate uptake regulator